jgi:hypothetical protein
MGITTFSILCRHPCTVSSTTTMAVQTVTAHVSVKD